MAPWWSGYTTVCKTVYTGSNPVGVSNTEPLTGSFLIYKERRKGMFENFNEPQNETNDVTWNTEQSWSALDSWQEDYIMENYAAKYRATTAGDYDWQDGSFDEGNMTFEEFDIYHDGTFLTTVDSASDIEIEILHHFFDQVCDQDLYNNWGDDV